MLQELFPRESSPECPGFEPVLFRLVFHWVCILGVYRLPVVEVTPGVSLEMPSESLLTQELVASR